MPFLLSFFIGDVLFFSARLFPFSSMVFFLGITFWLIRNNKAIMALFIVVGFFFALLRISFDDGKIPLWNRNMEVKGKFLQHDLSVSSGHGLQPFVIKQAFDEETGQEIEDMEDEKIWVRSDEEAEPGATYDLLIRTGRDRTRLNPGSMGRSPVYASVIGVRGNEEERRLFSGVFDSSRQSLGRYLERSFSKDTAAFISAVTIGEVHLDEELKNAFNTTGLAHILSISGTHFGLFSVVIFGCFVFLIKRLPYTLLQRVTLHVSPSQAAAIICMPLMVLYLGISGGSLPAMRSFVMISFFLAGLLLGRSGFWLHTVLLAACALVLWDPEVVLGLSFQLSFIAVLFIGFAVERKDDEERAGENVSKPSAFIKNSLRLTLAATIGTAPLVAYHFNYLSLISPLANLLIAPLIGFIVIPLALVSSFSYLLTGVYLFAPIISAATDISLRLVRVMAKIPYADIAIPAFPPVLIFLFYAAFLVYLAQGRKRVLLIMPCIPFLACILISMFSPKELSVTFLDVGQGDSAVVELPDGKTVVIDTGRTGHETAGFLKFIGKRQIDALTLTHSHPDHTGGLAYILGRYAVSEIWDNGLIDYPSDLDTAVRHHMIGRGDVIEKSLYCIKVLHPYQEFSTIGDNEYVEDNNASLVLRISGKRYSFLFAGDVEEESEDDLSHLGKWLRSDVIKIPHHGGRTSVHAGLLSDISPAIAVISVGRDNTFGHPSQEMLQVIADTRIYRTDRDGAVKIAETDSGLRVKTYADHAFEKADTLTGELKNIKRLLAVW